MNPKAVPLRVVWTRYGTEPEQYIGSGLGGLPDITGDGIAEFAVFDAATSSWNFYYGRKEPLSTSPDVVMKPFGVVDHPVVGHFWGGRGYGMILADGYFDTINNVKYIASRLHLFRMSSSGIDTSQIGLLDPKKMAPTTRIAPLDMQASDLDGDGADELILVNGGILRNGVSAGHGEIWIFRGGAEFTIDTPTVVITYFGGAEGVFIGRWDRDQHSDLAIALGHATEPRDLRIFFGRPGSPWNWTTPDRIVGTDDVYGRLLAALDCDGDSLLDLVIPPSVAHPNRLRLYLSSSGKDIRTRPFDSADADETYFRYQDNYSVPVNFGYIADSLGRYATLGIAGAEGSLSTMLLLNGGPNGPDHQFDAFYQGEVFGLTRPIGDVTGDGWNDVIEGYGTYGNFNEGAAVIWAGGPYIPRDSTSGVEEIVVAGMHDAVSVWPNPVCDELHIAWRGDLRRFPEQFVIDDITGREVARGSVEAWRGEAYWRCSARPAGVYFVRILDGDGHLLATTRIVKQ